MNENCSYWMINLINDDRFDYLSNGTFSQVEQKNDSLGQNGQWGSSQI